MAKIFGQPGSTIEFFKKLREQGVDSIKTLEDVAHFKKYLSATLDQIKINKKAELEEDIKSLGPKINQLQIEYFDKLQQRKERLEEEKKDIKLWLERYPENSKKFFYKLFNWAKHLKLQKRLELLTHEFDKELKRPLEEYASEITALKEEMEDKKANPGKWVDRMSEKQINHIKHVDSVIDSNKEFYYGAIGEERALAELKKLPDTYSVINDLCREFPRPIYDRKNDDRIYSIQVDHVIIGPTGLFIIETKNWSQASVNSLDLFSPVKQLQRSSFALFVCLNGASGSAGLYSFNQHWGKQKISPKNIILMMNHKPNREYQHVRISLLSEVNNYITSGENIFSEEQVRELSHFLYPTGNL